MSHRFQRVFVASGEVHAQQIRAFLNAAGIDATLQGEALRHTHGFTLDGLGAVEIRVPEGDAERARELLASAEVGAFRLPEDAVNPETE